MLRSDLGARPAVRQSARVLLLAPLLAPLLMLPIACGGSARAADVTADGQLVRTRRVVTVDNALVALEPTAVTARREEIALSPDRAWALLPAVYDGLGLTLGLLQSDTRELGTGILRVQGRIANTRMSLFIDCGSTGLMGMAAADSYQVQLHVRTRVLPSSDSAHAILGTTVLASARPLAVSGSTVNCPSSGALERRIAVALTARAATMP